MINARRIIDKIDNNPKRSFGVVFAGLIIYQILLIFQGFDVCDSGWYATFYQNIFSNPASVEYNFLYWFTGIVGGLFVKLFPESGLLGIRLLGVVNVSAIIFIVYMLLYKHINNRALYIGLIIVTISFVGTPTEFFHNNLSSLLFVGASLALYNGLERDNPYLFALSSLLLALNVFTRLPNLLDIGIIFIVVIHSYYYKETKFITIKRIIILLATYIISIICILGIMKLLGHYQIYMRSLNGLSEVAVGNTQNTHGLSKMIFTNINSYKSVIVTGSFSTAFILLLAYFLSLFNLEKYKKYKWLGILVTLLILAYFIRKFSSINLLYYFSLISLLYNIIFEKRINLKILSWIGLFMLIVMPLGSDYAIGNFGNYSVWIAIPLVINLFISEEFVIELNINSFSLKKQFNLRIDHHYLKMSLSLFLLIFISKVLLTSVNTSYFDPGSRILKTYKINSDKAKGIFTTRERAKTINDLLFGIDPFLKAGDYLIAYESIPMIYYLTNTKPFLYDSWLMSSASMPLKLKIERVYKENRPLPIVIRQKFETIGHFGNPSDEYISDKRKSTNYVSQEQTRIFNKFLIDNNYKIVWNNSYFNLYEPQSKQKVILPTYKN